MFLIGLFLAAFSLPMAVSNISKLNSLSSYLYYTSYAESVRTKAILFSVITGVAVILMIVGWVRRRSSAAIQSIVNKENQNYCNYCKVNVATHCTVCPICGRPLK